MSAAFLKKKELDDRGIATKTWWLIFKIPFSDSGGIKRD